MTDKSIFMLTMGMLCIWLVLDNFYGEKRVNTFLLSLFPALEKSGSGWLKLF